MRLLYTFLLVLICGHTAFASKPILEFENRKGIRQSCPNYIKILNAHQLINKKEVMGIFRGQRFAKVPRIFALDDAIDFYHKDLKKSLVKVNKFFGNHEHDWKGHGTHVAGIIHRLCPHAQIQFYSIEPRNRAGKYIFSEESFCKALEAVAKQKGDIVNISYGFVITERIKKALKAVVDSGKIITMAFGNEFNYKIGTEISEGLIDFANSSEMRKRLLLIANLKYNKRVYPMEALCPSSNRLVKDLKSQHVYCAPGTNIYSTLRGGKYGVLSGTSMSAPGIAGSLGLLMMCLPGFECDDYVDFLREGCRKKSITYSIPFGPEGGNGVPDLLQSYKVGEFRRRILTGGILRKNRIIPQVKKVSPKKKESPPPFSSTYRKPPSTPPRSVIFRLN
jgi:hypothetical protein